MTPAEMADEPEMADEMARERRMREWSRHHIPGDPTDPAPDEEDEEEDDDNTDNTDNTERTDDGEEE